MRYSSRELLDTIVRGLAKVGLVWALAVLGALFVGTAALAESHDGAYAVSAAEAGRHEASLLMTRDTPRLAGVALVLTVLGTGVTVLCIGASRGEQEVSRSTSGPADPAADLSLALDVGLLA